MEGVSSRWNSNVLLLSAFPENGGFIGRDVDPADAAVWLRGQPEPPPPPPHPRPPARKPRSELPWAGSWGGWAHGPSRANFSPASRDPGEPSALRAATHPGARLPHPAHGRRDGVRARLGNVPERGWAQTPGLGREPPGPLLPPL